MSYERREKEGKDGKKVYFFAPTDQYFAMNPNYDEKYIIYQHGQWGHIAIIIIDIINISFSSGSELKKEMSTKKEVYFATTEHPYHYIIGEELARNLNTTFRDHHVKVDYEKKKISTYGKSGGFGAPDIEEVRSILSLFFDPSLGWDLSSLTITNFVRG